jgi:RNA polymerase sigma factor (TIGR02999 family)
MPEFTALIQRARAGDQRAHGELFTALYADLHSLARQRLSRGGRATLLDTTVLVHEAYLRLTRAGGLQVEDRSHLMAYAARAMRSVIVDLVRSRRASRRGGDLLQVTFNTGVMDVSVEGESEILRLHDALEELGRLEPRLVQVVEMRYFAGLTEPEIAVVLGLNERTVRRDWEKARLLLAAALR